MHLTRLTMPLAAAAAIFFTSTLAAAQPGPPPPPPPPAGGGYAPAVDPAFAYHQGIMVGVGVGLGIASCSDCDNTRTSLALDFHIGGFLNPRLALMYDVGAWADSENDTTLVLSSNTFAAQYWVAPRVWIKGGLGASLAQISFNGDSDSETGFAITGAAGYEISQNGNFAMDISGRLSILDFDGGSFTIVHALFGFRWT